MRERRYREDSIYGKLEPYKITAYEQVYVVMKGFEETYKHRIRFSASKRKYFLTGKVIEWMILSEGGQYIRSYPTNQCISLVDHRDMHMFSTCQYQKAKEKLILNIPYDLIEYILLDFNSYDWKKR